MTKPELFRLMRLLSSMETALLCKTERVPDHLIEEADNMVKIIEREILKDAP